MIPHSVYHLSAHGGDLTKKNEQTFSDFQRRLPFTRKTRKFWLANEMNGVNGKRPGFMAEREDNVDCIQEAVAS